jgi:hypothetical protein
VENKAGKEKEFCSETNYFTVALKYIDLRCSASRVAAQLAASQEGLSSLSK